MTATTPSTALVTIQPVFTESERLALAGFLAGYRGLTREAYTLDRRQFTAWCRLRSLSLFSVRRADIETFARELEARGRAAPPSPGGCAPSRGSIGTPSRKNSSIIPRPHTSADPGWIMRSRTIVSSGSAASGTGSRPTPSRSPQRSSSHTRRADRATVEPRQVRTLIDRLAVVRHELAGGKGRAGGIGKDCESHPWRILRLGEDRASKLARSRGGRVGVVDGEGDAPARWAAVAGQDRRDDVFEAVGCAHLLHSRAGRG